MKGRLVFMKERKALLVRKDMAMFNVEYSWQNLPQEDAYGVCSKDFDSWQEAYEFAAKVIARAAKRNKESPLCCSQHEDNFQVDLRITRVEHDRRWRATWQLTLLTLTYNRTEEHAMWHSQTTGQVIFC